MKMNLVYSDSVNSVSLTYDGYNYLALKNFINKELRGTNSVISTLNKVFKNNSLLLLNEYTPTGIVVEAQTNGLTTIKDVDSNRVLYSGVAWDGANWEEIIAKESNPNAKYIGKVVEFKYLSGSKPGSKRILTVKEADATLLKGIDAEKGEWRQFNVDKIVKGTLKQLSE